MPEFTELGAGVGVVGNAFGEDIARAGEHVGDGLEGVRLGLVGDGVAHVGGGCGDGVEGRILRPELFGEGLESEFFGDGGAGAFFGPEGQVNVLEFGGVPACFDALAKLIRKFALLFDGFQNRLPALVEFLEFFQLLLDFSNFHFVKRSGNFLAVTGNERDGSSFFQKSNRIFYFFYRNIQGLSN